MNTAPLTDAELATIQMAATAAMAGGRIGLVCKDRDDTPAKFRARIAKDWPLVRLHFDGPGPTAGVHTLVLVKADPSKN